MALDRSQVAYSLTRRSQVRFRGAKAENICSLRDLPVLTHLRHRLWKSRSAAVSCRTEVCYPFGRKHGSTGVKLREFITLLGGAAAAWLPALA
jgi:hypothetical protein